MEKKKVDKPKRKAAAKPKKKQPIKKLTEKHKSFVHYFIELGHQTDAAIKAGYSPKSARSIASRLMIEPLIKEYMSERMEAKDNDRIASEDEILSFLTKTMRGEIKDQVPILNGDGYQKLVELDATQTKDRIKAAEMLGKRYVMWTEKKAIEGNVGVTMIVDDTGDYEEDGEDE